MKQRVLVIGDSMSLAHVARAMVAARRLAAEGHDVDFATGKFHIRLAEQEGFRPHTVHCVDPADAVAAIRRGGHIFDRETLRAYVESDLELLRSVKPDLVVGDMRLSLNISAEVAGVRYVNIVNGYNTRYYSGPLEPPESYPLVRVLGKRFSRRLLPLIRRGVTRYYAASFRAARAERKMSPVRDIFDVVESPYGNLIADLPELIPCSGLPAHFRYLGPLVWEPAVPPPAWLDSVPSDKPMLYVPLGSTGNDERYFEILETLAAAGYGVIATTGFRKTPVPPSVLAVEAAPGSAILKKCRAVVCHGGSLTIYQAVREGVPIVGIPTFHDQELNMDNVSRLGWGVKLRPARWTKKELLAAVEEVLSAKSVAALKAGAASFARQIEHESAVPLV